MKKFVKISILSLGMIMFFNMGANVVQAIENDCITVYSSEQTDPDNEE